MDNYWSLLDYVQEKKQTNDEGKKFTVRFGTVSAILNAAYAMVSCYDTWENQGIGMFPVDVMAYRFNMSSGQMDRLSNKNIKGFTKTISKKEMLQIYTAPELLLSEEDEIAMTADAQNWTLAVLLFQLFYHTMNPLMGKESMNQVFLKPEDEYVWYAKHAVFAMDAENMSNRPVHGVQGHLIKYWNFYPEVLQNAFRSSFTEGKVHPEKRLTPHEWKQIINSLFSLYTTCNCGFSGFMMSYDKTAQGFRRCPKCQNVYYPLAAGNKRIYITAGSRIMAYQIYPDQPDSREIIAEVVENRQKRGVFGIKNLSKEKWKGTFPNKEEREIAPGNAMPLWPQLEIIFADDEVWSIKGEES